MSKKNIGRAQERAHYNLDLLYYGIAGTKFSLGISPELAE